MKTKGAVICFQKFVLGHEMVTTEGTVPDGPVCLGYMDRIDVTEVHNFKQYIRVASQHGVEYPCTRKQLLIYKLDEKFDKSINIASTENHPDALPPVNRAIPFYSAETNRFFGLCCCSVVNISPELQSQNPRESADLLYHSLKEFQEKILARGQNMEFAITGLLGGEDLCLIILSDYFSAISDAFSVMQDIEKNGILVMDNTHSMLVMDCSGLQCEWGDAHAEILFSTRAKTGLEYVDTVFNELKNLDKTVTIEGAYGEYDAVIRCPARLLTPKLFTGEDGLLSYYNPVYQKLVYQSETQVFPFGDIESGSEDKSYFAAGSMPDSEVVSKEDLEEAMRQITVNLLGRERDEYEELTYVRSSLHRLLKDYSCIMAAPLNIRIHHDLTIQFQTALSAIVLGSKGPPAMFNIMFDRIINALDSAMHIAGQQDRFSFDEQPSHLQNVGSYYKILLAYYGFIKQVIQLLYSVQRDEKSRQATLVPLISFGMTPIIKSTAYEAEYKQGDEAPVPAKLLCILLPYQALANPPKYLGILVHEVFHYICAPQTGGWNQALVECVVKKTIGEFLDLLAQSHSKVPIKPADSFSSQDAYADIIDNAAKEITESFFFLPETPFLDMEKLRFELFNYLDFRRVTTSLQYGFYRSIWKNLRKQFEHEKEDADVANIFAFNETGNEDELFDKSIQKVLNFNPLRFILSSYYDTFLEVTADLFSIGIVLNGQDRKTQARQFMWQIYSTRSDFTYGSEEQNTRPVLTTNMIRFGIMMDHLLDLSPGTEGCRQFSEYLKEWLPKPVKEADRFGQMQVIFRHEYSIYKEYTCLYTEQAKKYLEIVETALESLNQNPECVKKMREISALYQSYYQALDDCHGERMSYTDLGEKAFEQSIHFIEHYQEQLDIHALNNSGAGNNPVIVYSKLQQHNRPVESPLRFYAESPEDLSLNIKRASEAMSVRGKLPVIWYRGQRNKYADTLPGMFRDGSDFAIERLRQSLRLSRAQILPYGIEFEQPQWLAYLQHNEFKTNVLDFSESFYPSLYFAIQRWIDKPDKFPPCDSHISMLNPILFNLAMYALDHKEEDDEEFEESKKKLIEYLENGTLKDGVYMELPLFARGENYEDKYSPYFSWDMKKPEKTRRPIAVLTPKNSERMKKQIGQFIFYDLFSEIEPQPKEKAETTPAERDKSMEALHREYLDLLQKLNKERPDNPLPCIPFLCEIHINRYAHKEFVQYVRAIGLRKYHVYPEADKLAKDIEQILQSME